MTPPRKITPKPMLAFRMIKRKLGRRNRPELHTDHQDQDRAQGKRPSRQEAVCQGHQNLRPSDGSTQPQTTHFAAEVELHIASIQEWEIIFASVLSAPRAHHARDAADVARCHLSSAKRLPKSACAHTNPLTRGGLNWFHGSRVSLSTTRSRLDSTLRISSTRMTPPRKITPKPMLSELNS